MLIPSQVSLPYRRQTSLSRRVNANSQPFEETQIMLYKLIKKGEC